MSDTRKPEILKKVQDYLESAGEGGQTKLANAIGYNTSSGINQYLKGTYPSIKPLEAKLAEYFAINDTATGMTKLPDYVPTSISEAVYKTIRYHHLQGGLAVECGDAGIGKTKAAEKYVSDYPNSAILVKVNPCTSSLTTFLSKLCDVLNVSEGRNDRMFKNCNERLSKGKKVLIVDEAQHLPRKTIETIRGFSDENEELGIVFIGNRSIIDNMAFERSKYSFSQITNRVKDDKIRLTSHIKKEDIELLFPVLKTKKMGMETDYLLGIAQSQQGIRGTMNLLQKASDNDNITYKGLVAMTKYMGMRI